MPRPPKYPLEPLLEHRERKVDDATVELGQAVKQREAAEAVKRRAERARRDAEERAAALRNEEAAKLATGDLRALDLMQAEAWEVGVRTEMNDLGRTVERATVETASARAEEAEARDALARKKAEQEVVAKDKERFTQARDRAVLAAEEQNAEEAWRDKRGNR